MYKISEGKDRFDKIPKWIDYTWEELINKFKNPIIGMETQAQYLSLPKNRQDDLKDTGWYIGGIQKTKGYRALNPLVYRSLITIDIDDCEDNSIYFKIDTLMKNTGFKGLVHSTRKHTNSKPRLRLIIPFKPNYGPSGDSANSEYEFICRKFAASIDMEMKGIDLTTFQPTRFMYWPSISRGADYYFKVWEGNEVVKDNFLTIGWEDRLSWPRHYMEKDIEKFPDRKQEDPHKKGGLIGAFCRVYSIQRVIEELLPEVYEQTVSNEKFSRYSYVSGSTANGARTYDDGKFLQSWHSTDAANGLHNAFDLLRIHKFQGNIKKTLKFIANFSDVKEELAKDELKENYETWKAELLRNENGNCISSYYNLKLILDNLVKIKYNQFNRRIEFDNKKKWFKHSETLEDKDLSELHVILEEEYGLKTSTLKIQNAVNSLSLNNSFHPIKEYLENLKWDGKNRIETLLPDMFGVDDNPYHRAVMRKFLLAAITRIYKPGYIDAKFDTVLTLVGEEDVGKSSFFRVLFSKDYFTDSITCLDMESKSGSEHLVGMWCVEIPDLSGMKKTSPDTIKGFVTRITDRFRPAFGRVTEDYHRTCVFGATTNRLDGFLASFTGNRRWLIVETGVQPVDLARLEKIRDQIWAEAYYLYKTTDEVLYLEDRYVKEMAKKLQNQFIETDANFEAIESYVNMPVPEDWHNREIYWRKQQTSDYLQGAGEIMDNWRVREEICVAEIWAELYKREIMERTRKDSENIIRCLLRMNFVEKKGKRITYMRGRHRVYVRKE